MQRTIVASRPRPSSQAFLAISAKLAPGVAWNLSTIARQTSASAASGAASVSSDNNDQGETVDRIEGKDRPFVLPLFAIFAHAQCLSTASGGRPRNSAIRSARRCSLRAVRRAMRCAAEVCWYLCVHAVSFIHHSKTGG
jgi:hypothetical protein